MHAEIRGLRRSLERVVVPVEETIPRLIELGATAASRALRLDACELLGDIAGRSYDAKWETAERAAWALIERARQVDDRVERRGLVQAMGRGFRNIWFMPYIHARLDDDAQDVVCAAIAAAGGLGFPALEEAIASRFLGPDVDPILRREAIRALGRMGAQSAALRLVPFLTGTPGDAAAAFGALTEIRSTVGADVAIALLDEDLPREVLVGAVRYLSELGVREVAPVLRRLARESDADLRLIAGHASRAFQVERVRDAGERLLTALTERDRTVRSVLARRLRTLPLADVLAQATALLADEPEGVIQVLAEVREPDVTRTLLALARRADLPVAVRARALSSIEANEPWEREALSKAVAELQDDTLRAAAARTMGAFATLEEVFSQLGRLATDPSPEVRGALLWAIQLSARPGAWQGGLRTKCTNELRALVRDDDPAVRRRAAYVIGNLRLDGLTKELIELAKAEEARVDLRVAAYVALGEIAAEGTVEPLIALCKREDDPGAFAIASRALVATLVAHPRLRADLSRIQGKISHFAKSTDATERACAVRLAAFGGGQLPVETLLALAADPASRVRDEAITALGRLGVAEGEPLLLASMDAPDPALHERAAQALLTLGTPRALERIVDFIANEAEDGESRARIAAALTLDVAQAKTLAPRLRAAVARLRPDDPAYEPLLEKVLAPGVDASATTSGAGVDAAISRVFPAFPRLASMRQFESLARSVRTAEALYGSLSGAGAGDSDFSPPIVLWMKALENHTHLLFAPRLDALQRESAFTDHVDKLAFTVWPAFQRYVAERWPDPVDVGAARVEVALRSVPNTLREFQERRAKRLDSPLSVTEWGRMLLLFAVEHPSGARNVLRVNAPTPEHVVRVAHRLLALAQVRNLVTHRATAAASTLEAFRRTYYATYEDLLRLA